MQIDDDTLIAYIDGQLDDTRCRAVEDALRADPALAARLDRLARAGELARRSLAPRFEAPVPPALIAAVWQAPDPRSRRPRAAGGWSPQGWWRLAGVWPRTALAGVLSLVAAGWLAVSLSTREDLLAGQDVRDEALALALDTAVSGEPLQTRDATLTLLGSFRAAGGEACRAFTRERETTETLAIACREDGAGWTIVFAAEGSGDDQAAGYRTASDERVAEADAFLQQSLRATALDADEERALIERGWRR